ncbi:Tex family protein [Flavisolibacter ginsenosidimutans]|uniref:RNA-binding transcriptional accessory protein n=1 Tax=Flavisolibacter ginsenosidimutans TaxID=661481 RepID=A0A5B8UE12_9BACT|nr:Tex family protein [Flavisolibacter ginsenosidimutans]QEC54921.1 RNA-binding transcriptional accessory protein [Flavisolibacter ginsenosidimutans]
MESKYLQKIAEKLSLSLKQITNVDNLQAEGATIPFMARYRKEATGNLDEVVIGNVVEELAYFADLEKRKTTVLKTIEDLGKLTPALKDKIENCYSATELEDIYLPYKPKRKTRAVQAIEKGLEPLAKVLFEQANVNLDEEAAKFITADVKDAKEALQGARDIIAEWVSEHEQARAKVRQLFTETATLASKVLTAKKEEADAQKYRDYFEFSESLSKSPSHRIMAIRRGEKEGFLLMDINIDKTIAVEELERIFIKASNAAATEVRKAIDDSYTRLLKPSIENEFRLLSKNKADEEAINVFTENLRQLLLASPLGSKNVLALDPGYRTGCKVVCLDAQGTFVYNTTIYPHPPQNQWQESVAEIKRLVSKFNIEAIGIGNGTAGRETEQLVRSVDFGKPVSIFQVNESGASIYSASEVAREEFPDEDVTVRGAISIGRRLLDPLSELVKIDPKSIGVGQYQHDVNQTKLKTALDRVVESAVNFVGVDVNTASKHLLQYVSGISSTLANNIVQYRATNGAFASREELKKVPLMGPKSFEQCAGFLRIANAENLLDNSSVHPERYTLVQQMAKDVQASLEELIKNAEVRKRINKRQYINETVGEYTVDDILKELEKPGRDPRAPIEEFQFDANIKSIEDVKTGMTVPGIVTNITAFGAFVDIGVKQDGLVHVSQLSNRYVSDPKEVVKLGQKVSVIVTEVDVARKRIALSMKTENGSQKPEVRKDRKPFVQKEQPLNSFQKSLLDLKKKFQ